MLYVGIDVAKNKHECCIIDTNGETVVPPFSISNDSKGFTELAQIIKEYTKERHINIFEDNIKLGAEGKHDHVALIHTAKRLVRLFYHLETTHTIYEQNHKKLLTVS